MLKRKRVLLGLVLWGRDNVRGVISRIRLMKYAFLLSKEGGEIAAHAGYQFVPYHYGPFSFALYRDLATFERNGYLVSTGEEERWVAAKPVIRKIEHWVDELPREVSRAIKKIINAYERMDTDALLKMVYRRYPWYATRSVRADLTEGLTLERPRAQMKVYTVGYAGKSVDGFFDTLMSAGIERVVDVRRNAVSRKYGFAKSSIKHISSMLQVEYVHVPELGILGKERRNLNCDEAYENLLNLYERETLPKQAAGLERVRQYVVSRPSALMCMEADARYCHRGRVARAIAKETGLDIQHI